MGIIQTFLNVSTVLHIYVGAHGEDATVNEGCGGGGAFSGVFYSSFSDSEDTYPAVYLLSAGGGGTC